MNSFITVIPTDDSFMIYHSKISFVYLQLITLIIVLTMYTITLIYYCDRNYFKSIHLQPTIAGSAGFQNSKL